MSRPLSGGCACGAIRFELRSEPFNTGWCHCETCRRNSGAPAMVFGSVPSGDLVFTQGEDRVKVFRSSGFAQRRFCGECGTPFTMEMDAQPDTVDIAVSTLDEPEAAAPGFHIFWSSKVGWFEPGDALPRHERFRMKPPGAED